MDSTQDKLSKVVEKQLRLISMEETAQREEQQEFLYKLSRQQLQRRGVALYNLKVNEQRTGLAGKTIVEFINPNTKVLPTHVLKVGDVVQIDRPQKFEKDQDTVSDLNGIVSKVQQGSISVAFKENFTLDVEDGLRILRLANDVAFRRMRDAFTRIRQLKSLPPVMNVIFGDAREVVFGNLYSTPEIVHDYQWYNPKLNESQKSAVLKALNSSELSLIHGPPGTGKTETLIEIIKQLVDPKVFKNYDHQINRKRRVLVCGPSNLSVDNILERLDSKDWKRDIDIVRVGHPARVLESLHQHTLDSRLANGDTAALAKDIRSEIDLSIKQLGKFCKNRREIYSQLKDLRRELRQREQNAIDRMVNETQIVLSTLNMTGSRLLQNCHFDVVIIDEAAQALEAECWLAILLCDKVIMAGDHCQLPPTVTSKEAENEGLSVTLFQRLAKKYPSIVSLLNVQYRMNEIIMKWSSEEFYNGQLVAADNVKNRRLCDLTDVTLNDYTEAVGVFMDTVGYDYREAQVDEDESKYNEGEANLIIQQVKNLIKSGISPKDIAIISPYNAQVALIESRLKPKDDPHPFESVEIGSVDGFQGREKEVVLISLVRSNENGEIGFLKETRRTNVAITRARRQIYVVGDSETLERHPFYKRLVHPFNLLK